MIEMLAVAPIRALKALNNKGNGIRKYRYLLDVAIVMGDVLARLVAVDVDLLERALVFEDMGEVLKDVAVEVGSVHLFDLAVDVLLDLVQVADEAVEAVVEVVLVLGAVEELEVVVLQTLDLLDHG